MMMWRLRRALNDPPPGLVWRAFVELARESQAHPFTALPLLSLLANLVRGVGLIILPIGAILFGAPLFILFMFLIFTSSPLLVPLANLMYGIAITYSVSGRIARERAKGRYDLLNTLPDGGVGLHWTYAACWILDHPAFRKLAFFMVFIGIIAAAFGVAAIFGTTSEGDFSTAAWVLSMICLMAIIAFDYTATPVTAALIAMITPAHTASASSTRFVAISVFVVVQIAAYLVGILTASAILPAIYQFFGVSDMVIAFTLPSITLIAFMGCRELIVRCLWEALRHAVNATPAEMEALC